MTDTTASALEAGPWKAESLPQGWDWIPGYGLYEQTDAAARLNLIYTWDQLGDLPDLSRYVERQKGALATLVSGITALGDEELVPVGFDEALFIGLILNRDSPQEVWQEQLYLRLGKLIGIVTASGPAARRIHLREALNLALKVAVFRTS